MTSSPINAALRDAQNQLKAVSDSARLEAEILLANVLECDRTYLRAWPEKILSTEQQTQYQQFIERRSAGEPIAYIIGQRDFWDMTLQVSPDTLIPRPETEHLVELALEKIPQTAEWHVADLGTGCGAIALAIARERPRCNLIATDISTAALMVARNNARNLNIRNVTFVEGNWLESIKGQQFEMILSNPPYIHPDDQHLCEGDLRFEPEQALCSKPDGLSDIRAIAKAARNHLVSPGWLILEHGYDQSSAVKDTLTGMGYSQVSTREDLAKNERISMGKMEEETGRKME